MTLTYLHEVYFFLEVYRDSDIRTKPRRIHSYHLQRGEYTFITSLTCGLCPPQRVSVMKTFKIYNCLLIFAAGFLLFDTANCLDVAEDVSHHKNIGLLKDSCGLAERDRISTRITTGLFEFRWMALIAYEGTEKNQFRCQGVLINDRYVLTSAHCSIHSPNNIKPVSVRLGEHDLNSDPDCQESLPSEPKGKRCAPAPQNIDIEEIIVHPSFKIQRPLNIEYDIALLRLASPVVSDYVNPICLPIGLPQQTKTFDKELTLVGWNRNWDGLLPTPFRLQVPVIGYDQCVAALKNVVNTSSERNICVGGRNEKDFSCHLSGSSLSYYTEDSKGHGRYVMAAIGSFGDTSCRTDAIPEVFTLVGIHMKWILDNMKP